MKSAAFVFIAAFAFLLGGCGMTPYAGMESRPIKALSAMETAAYLRGEGAGMAMAAELNGYPGPLHLLELADDLPLSDFQRGETARLFSQMGQEARLLGERIVAKEAELDSLFSEKRADDSSLREIVADIARLKGELRAVHLKYHLKTAPLLTAAQIARYEELRGYAHAH